MLRVLQRFVVLILFSLLIARCTPGQSEPAATAVSTSSLTQSIEPSPATNEQPTQTPTAPVAMTVIPHSTTDLVATPLSSPAAEPERFLIRSRLPGASDDAGTNSQTDAIETAVIAHLAARLNIPETAVTLISLEPTELPSQTPCLGNPTNQLKEETPGNAGISIGYEAVLQANDQTYQYAIIGNTGYACP